MEIVIDEGDQHTETETTSKEGITEITQEEDDPTPYQNYSIETSRQFIDQK